MTKVDSSRKECVNENDDLEMVEHNETGEKMKQKEKILSLDRTDVKKRDIRTVGYTHFAFI